jgi:hypothetical protein
MNVARSIVDVVRKRRTPEPVCLRVTQVQHNGQPILALVAATASDRDTLKAKRLREGDKAFATIKKPRNPGFHRLAHAIGRLVVENIEGFEPLTPHRALKRLQIESGAACEEVRIDGGYVCKVPMSLSYDSMDEGEFQQAVKEICAWISRRYWTSLTPEQIEAMADAMVEA